MTPITAVISSTVYDLREHREEVMIACKTLRVTPRMMEHLTASSGRPADVSEELVAGADVYIGIFGRRYGYVPEGDDISITERELLKAESAGLECLIFLCSDEHPWKFDQIDLGDNAEKLQRLRDRLEKTYTCKFFDSPSDLRAKVSEALIVAGRKREGEPLEGGQDPTQRLQREIDLKQCMNHLHGLTELKTMHDALHRIEIECYKPVRTYLGPSRRQAGAPFLIPVEAGFELEMSFNALDLVVGKLEETLAQNEDLCAEQTWVDELRDARDKLGPAIRAHDYSGVPECYRQIRRVLHRQPERLNARLISEARGFRNSELVGRLRNGDPSADSDIQREELRAILDQLDRLVAKHDAWQNMDFELRLIQYQAAENLEESWPLIRRQAEIIYGEDVAQWPLPLAELVEALNLPLGRRNSLQLNQQFLNFCALAGQHFDKVDQSLRMTCGKAVAAFSSIEEEQGNTGGAHSV